jgi:hypothetical protein
VTDRSAGAVATAGRIDALGGTGALPCRIRFARCVTAFGNAGPTRSAFRGNAAFGLAITGTGRPLAMGLTKPCPGRLIVWIARALWMLLKMMLLRGGRR